MTLAEIENTLANIPVKPDSTNDRIVEMLLKLIAEVGRRLSDLEDRES